MKIAIIDNNTIHLDELKNALSPHEIEVVAWRLFPSASATVKSADAVIISGGINHALPLKRNIYGEQLAILQSLTQPLLGICAGMQILAFAYGAVLERQAEKIEGLRTFSIQQDDALFVNITDTTVYQGHRWMVKDVPSHFITLGVSEECIEVIKHRQKPHYGVQFHPEVMPEQTCGKMILQNFLALARTI